MTLGAELVGLGLLLLVWVFFGGGVLVGRYD